MGQFLFYYQRPEPATWVYLSSFLVIGIYFMFHRLWSLRNLDIALMLLLTPGLMLVYEGRKKVASVPPAIASAAVEEAKDPNPVSKSDETLQKSSERTSTEAANVPQDLEKTDDRILQGGRLQFWGFVWLLSVCACWVLRMLLDTVMVRRPLLEPNLSSGGLTFIGVSLFLFLMANIITSTPEEQRNQGQQLGPGYVLLNMLPAIQTTPDTDPSDPSVAQKSQEEPRSVALPTVARVLAIVANFVLVLGMVCIGYWHFGNLKTGIGAATLFLLLPYTAQMTGRVDHVLPGAMLVTAVLFYRIPLFSGFFLGCAAGLVYYPFFLLPLWLSFYWERGVRRFTVGFSVALIGLTVALVAYSQTDLLTHLRQMYGVFLPATEGLGGIWGLGWYPHFRLPILVAFILFCLSFIFWPAQKNLATLMNCTGAIMTAAQFWHGYGGGLYMAWFLPLVMLTVFSPNLDDRIALSVVRSSKRIRKPSDSASPESSLAQAG